MTAVLRAAVSHCISTPPLQPRPAHSFAKTPTTYPRATAYTSKLTMEAVLKVTDTLRSIRETKLSGLRPVSEFFDYQRLSRPADMNQATARISYNTRYFSGNYLLIVALLAVYAVVMNYYLLFSLIFLVGGFTLINKFAPEATQVGEHTVTQKHLYAGLFVIGIPMFLWAGPFSTFFSIVFCSVLCILVHASLLEPGVESDYATVQDQV